MNRREALKKLGVGSAVVVGATAVKSLPAFAFANPVITGNLDVTVNGNAKTPTATISIGSATCTGSALAPCGTCAPGDAEIISFTMTAWLVSVATAGTAYGWGSTSAAASANLFPPVTFGGAVVSGPVPSPYTDPSAAGWGSYTVPFRHLKKAVGGSVVDTDVGDTIQITGEVQYTCTYGDGVSSISDIIDYNFTKIGTSTSGGWTIL